MSHQPDEPKPKPKKRTKRRASSSSRKAEPPPTTWVSKYGIGRPSSYKPEYCDLLIEHMKQGKSFQSFGAQINVAASTLYNWAESHKDFLEAYKVGKTYCLEFWESISRNQAAGIIPNAPQGANYRTVAGAQRITAFMLAVHAQPPFKEDYGIFLGRPIDKDPPNPEGPASVTFEYSDQKQLPAPDPAPDIEMEPQGGPSGGDDQV